MSSSSSSYIDLWPENTEGLKEKENAVEPPNLTSSISALQNWLEEGKASLVIDRDVVLHVDLE